MGSNVYVGLGSNLNNPASNLRQAVEAIRRTYSLQAKSSVLTTEPFETATDRPFKNQVVEIDPGKDTPEALLRNLLELEELLGRNREKHPSDRVIDLDLLYYNQTIRHSDQLHVPHLEVHRRPFVLKSMVELNPTFLHPEKEMTQTELLVNSRSQHSDN